MTLCLSPSPVSGLTDRAGAAAAGATAPTTTEKTPKIMRAGPAHFLIDALLLRTDTSASLQRGAGFTFAPPRRCDHSHLRLIASPSGFMFFCSRTVGGTAFDSLLQCVNRPFGRPRAAAGSRSHVSLLQSASSALQRAALSSRLAVLPWRSALSVLRPAGWAQWR